MNPYAAKIKTFMQAMGQATPESPSTTDYPHLLRACLVLEEALEFVEASGCYVARPDAHRVPVDLTVCATRTDAAANASWPGMVDAIVDLLYVTFGAALAMGLGDELDEFFDLVHNANMAKLGPDGKPIIRADGKRLKPEGWTPPDIEKLLKLVILRRAIQPAEGYTKLSTALGVEPTRFIEVPLGKPTVMVDVESEQYETIAPVPTND